MGAALVVSVGLALVGVSDRIDRLARGPDLAAGFRLVLPSGTPALIRGEPVTLSALMVPLRDRELPAAADLVIRHRSGETHFPMTAVGGGAFTATIPGTLTTAPFEYAVSAGPQQSPWQPVRVGEPVHLTACTFTIHSPAYTHQPPRTVAGWQPIDALTGSELTLNLECEPALARLQLHRTSRPGDAPLELPVEWADSVATARFSLPDHGTLTLTLTSPAGIESVLATPLRATPDRPPEFTRVVWPDSSELRVPPGSSVRLEVAARDDLAVAAVNLEWAADDGSVSQVEPVPMSGLQTPHASGGVELQPTRSARFRLSLRDAHPDRAAVHYPPTGWLSLVVDANAPAVTEQLIRAEQTRIACELTTARHALSGANNQLQIVLTAPVPAEITLELDTRLRAAAADVRTAQNALARLGFALPDAAELGFLSQPLPHAETILTQLQVATVSEPGWVGQVQEAARLLASADRDLADQLKRAEWVVAGRRDVAALRSAATGLQAGTAPADRPAAIVAGSAWLQSTLTAASQADVRDRARQAATLKDEFTVFAQATADWHRRWRTHHARPLIPAQQAFNQSVQNHNLAPATRIAGVQELHLDELEAVLNHLAAGELLEAAVAQERAAADVDRLAERLGALVEARRDRHEFLKQLARWQATLPASNPNADNPEHQAFERVCAAAGLPPNPDVAELARTTPPLRDRVRVARERLRPLHTELDDGAATPDKVHRLSAVAETILNLDVGDCRAERGRAAAAVAQAASGGRADLADAKRQLSALNVALTDRPTPQDTLIRLLAHTVDPGTDAQTLASETIRAAELARPWSPWLADRLTARANAFLREASPANRARLIDALEPLVRRASGDETLLEVVQQVRAALRNAPPAERGRWVQLLVAELQLTPAGNAVEFVQSAAAVLKEGSAQEADAALERLAAEVASRPERIGFAHVVGPHPRTDRESLPEVGAGEYWVNRTAIPRLHSLSVAQRRLRDATTAAFAEANRLPTPRETDSDPLATAAKTVAGLLQQIPERTRPLAEVVGRNLRAGANPVSALAPLRDALQGSPLLVELPDLRSDPHAERTRQFRRAATWTGELRTFAATPGLTADVAGALRRAAETATATVDSAELRADVAATLDGVTAVLAQMADAHPAPRSESAATAGRSLRSALAALQPSGPTTPTQAAELLHRAADELQRILIEPSE